MKTITLSPSQYRVVECSSTVNSAVSSAARASRMSQATIPPAKTTHTTHPIYGIVNLALLTVSLYLLWANL